MPFKHPDEAKNLAISLFTEDPKADAAVIAAKVNASGLSPRPVSKATIGVWKKEAGVGSKGRRSKAEVAELDAQLVSIVMEMGPMGARSVAYQASGRGLIPKTEQAFEMVGNRLIALRDLEDENGTPTPAFPLHLIEDGLSRTTYWAGHWSPEDALTKVAEGYRRYAWHEFERSVIVIEEKVGLAALFRPVCGLYDIPLVTPGGFGSISLAYSTAKLLYDAGRPALVLHFGDHDPSGLHIDRSFERRLNRYAPTTPIEWRRVAVTPEQVGELSLPSRPTKVAGNPHAKGWEGGDSVELDSIRPADLKRIAREAIEGAIDLDLVARIRAREAEEKAKLELLASTGLDRLIELVERHGS